MRKQLTDSLLKRTKNEMMCFLTADLGFMALEPLRDLMGKRFINVGVAEQNMISVAAAMSKQGFEIWAYSISPFVYARPFEQIRNDICFHAAPVKLIGNGGGYAYGVMGPTHHAIEDYGVLLTLPNIEIYIPAFDEDIEDVVNIVGSSSLPSYLRLGRGEIPKNYIPPKYSPWRNILDGEAVVVISIGPISGTFIEAFSELSKKSRPSFWILSELPLEKNPLPNELIDKIRSIKKIFIIEEHVKNGSLGAMISLFLMKNNIQVDCFLHSHAQSHQFKTYGSQNFLRKKSKLDPKSILKKLLECE